RRERADRGGARDVHRQGDLAEVVAGPEHPPRAHALLADDEHAGEDNVESLAGLALDDRRLSGGDLLTAHPARQLLELLAGQLGQERAAVQLMLGCRDVTRHRGSIVPPWVESRTGASVPAARRSSSTGTSAWSAGPAGSSRTRTRSRRLGR